MSALLASRRRAQQLQRRAGVQAEPHLLPSGHVPRKHYHLHLVWTQTSVTKQRPEHLGRNVVVEHMHGKVVTEGVWLHLGAEPDPAARLKLLPSARKQPSHFVNLGTLGELHSASAHPKSRSAVNGAGAAWVLSVGSVI